MSSDDTGKHLLPKKFRKTVNYGLSLVHFTVVKYTYRKDLLFIYSRAVTLNLRPVGQMWMAPDHFLIHNKNTFMLGFFVL